MPDSTSGEISLLKESCKVIREIADFFAGEDDRAQRARKWLEKRQKSSAKGKTSAAFYANISVDLVTLDETLQGLADTWSDGQGPGIRATRHVLQVLEDEFLVKEQLINDDDSEDGGESSEREDEENSHVGQAVQSTLAMADKLQQKESLFMFLQTFVTEFENEFGDEPDDADKSARIDWFCQVTKFGCPNGKSRDMLLQAVKGCDAVLKPMSTPKTVDVSYQSVRGGDFEWAEAGEAFRFVERLHDTLEHWDCNCFAGMSHRNAKFAFDLGSPVHHGSVAGTIFYPWLDPQSNKSSWRPAHLEFQEDGHSPTLRLPTQRGAFATDDRSSKLSDLCDLLDDIAIRGEGAVKLAAGKPRLCDVPMHTTAFQDLLTNGDSSLVDCYNLPQPQRLLKMSSKHRMSVALVLAYAYLYLGGGSWWPYHKKPNLHSPDIASEDIPPSRLVFFSPNFSKQPAGQLPASDEELPYVLTAFNADMPSLPAFGKLLLELFLGQSVGWDELNTRLERAREEPLATEILQAVSTCLATGADKTFKGGGTIRDDERLRTHFVKGVMMPIQYVLRVGYHLKPQDIFKTPSTSGVVEIKELPPRRLRPHSPMRVDGPETIGDGFCLHDGQDGLEELSRVQ